jgi:hypothetical protein
MIPFNVITPNPQVMQVVDEVTNLKNMVAQGMNNINQISSVEYSDGTNAVSQLFQVALLNERLRDDMFAENYTFENVGVDIYRDDLSQCGFNSREIQSYSQAVFSTISGILKGIPAQNLARAGNDLSIGQYYFGLGSYVKDGLLPRREIDTNAGGFVG